MSDQTPLVRQWTVLRILSARRNGLTVRELAQEMEVGDKTIRRDLELFRGLGIPIEEEIGDRGLKRYRLKSDWHGPQMGFTFDEAIALYLGRRFLDPLAGTLFWEAAQRAFRKIRSTLGDAAIEYLERFQGIFLQTAIGVSDYSTKADLIDSLMVAIEDGKAVHLAYRSQTATEPVTRDVYPYGLVYHRGSLYLVAHAPEHDQVRHYKLDRLESVEISKWPFKRQSEFDLAAHLAGSFGVYQGDGAPMTVRVRFAPEVARYVLESKWHVSQKLTPQRDGSVLAVFQLKALEEIKSWVLSFGMRAVVLEPETLREQIRQELEQLQAAYGLVRGEVRVEE